MQWHGCDNQKLTRRRVVFPHEHHDQEPLRPQGKECRGEETQDEEGRVTRDGEEGLHGWKIADEGFFVKSFAPEPYRVSIFSFAPKVKFSTFPVVILAGGVGGVLAVGK